MNDSAIHVRGAATSDEVAAVVSALAARRAAAEPPADRYTAWRQGRLATARPAGTGSGR